MNGRVFTRPQLFVRSSVCLTHQMRANMIEPLDKVRAISPARISRRKMASAGVFDIRCTGFCCYGERTMLLCKSFLNSGGSLILW
jgi:hypothetical protein